MPSPGRTGCQALPIRWISSPPGILDIARVVEHALDTVPRAPLTLEAVYAADRAARAAAEEACR